MNLNRTHWRFLARQHSPLSRLLWEIDQDVMAHHFFQKNSDGGYCDSSDDNFNLSVCGINLVDNVQFVERGVLK